MSDDEEVSEALQLASTSVTYPHCPHCGGELALLAQTKVWLAEDVTEIDSTEP